jgi:phage regulator Rha-like protein
MKRSRKARINESQKNETLSNVYSQSKTMSSSEISKITGIEHANVLKDCNMLNDNYVKMSLPKIKEVSYVHPDGKKQHEYLLNKIQCLDLISGYNTGLRIRVNRR